MHLYENQYPKLDLHGEYVVTAYTVVHNFITDQIKLKEEYLILIHGKGTGKLREGIHAYLKTSKYVKSYRIAGFGEGDYGVTIVELK